MADVIGTPALRAEFDSRALLQGAKEAGAKLKTTFEQSNRNIEAAQRNANKRIQGLISQLNADRPRRSMFELGQAVQHMGGVAQLSEGQVARLRKEVERLTAAGAKAPKSLAGLVAAPSGLGQLGAAASSLVSGGGISGALAALGPAGLAASAGIGAVAIASTKAILAVKQLAGEAEQWVNLAKSTGLGAAQVQQLQSFLADAGIPAESLKTGMKELQKEIAGGGKELQKFGIDIAAIKDLSPEEQLRAMASTIASIEDPAIRVAAAIAAFGRGGADLIPALDGIARGADKMFSKFSDAEIQRLAEVDAAFDRLSRGWDKVLGRAAIAAVFTADVLFSGGRAGGIAAGRKAAGPASGGPRDESRDDAFWAEQERQMAQERAEQQATAKERQALSKQEAAEAKKGFEERLRSIRAENEAAAALIKAREEETRAIQRTQQALVEKSFAGEDRARGPAAAGSLGSIKAADQALFERSIQNAKKLFADLTAAGVPAQQALEQVRGRLEGVGLSSQDLESVMSNLPQALEGATSATVTWSNQLADLAHIMESSGGLLGKLGSILGSLAGGISGFGAAMKNLGGAGGGLGKGIAGFLKKLGGGVVGKIGSALGKAVPFISTALSVLSIGKSLFSGVKGLFGGGRDKKDAAEASKILGEKVSKEQIKALKEEAKAQGKDWRTYLKERKAQDDRNRAIEARQKLESGLGTARGGAEALQERLAKGGLSEGLTAALQTLIGKVGDALLRSGLGILDARLKESEEFGAAQGTAAEIAQVIAGMREAGLIDQGLLAAGGAAAGELRQQATAAAVAQGLSPEEAAKAGSAAIAPLLREQLNASIQSGKELDETTKALLQEAKANGIEILADPAIASLDVQRSQLEVLKDIAKNSGFFGGGGEGTVHAARGLGPVRMPNMGRGLGPIIQTHAGELAWILPASLSRRGGLIHAAKGVYDDMEGGFGGGGGGPDTGTSSEIATVATIEAALVEQFEAAVDRIAAQIQTAAQPITIENPVSIQIVDQSAVKTVEGQKAFGRHVVAEVEGALDRNSRGLESRIERIARRAITQG